MWHLVWVKLQAGVWAQQQWLLWNSRGLRGLLQEMVRAQLLVAVVLVLEQGRVPGEVWGQEKERAMLSRLLLQEVVVVLLHCLQVQGLVVVVPARHLGVLWWHCRLGEAELQHLLLAAVGGPLRQLWCCHLGCRWG